MWVMRLYIFHDWGNVFNSMWLSVIPSRSKPKPRNPVQKLVPDYCRFYGKQKTAKATYPRAVKTRTDVGNDGFTLVIAMVTKSQCYQ